MVSGAGSSFAGPVQLGVDGTGNVQAAWAQINASSVLSVASATLAATGGWSSPTTLATPAGHGVRQVSVAVNANGAAVVGWVRVANDTFGDVVTRPAGGGFGAPVTIATGFLRPVQDQLHALKVAMDATGRASAAWNVVYAYASAQQADGTRAPATVFQASGYSSNVALGIDATGTAQMLWTVSGSTQSSSLPPGGSWGPATAVFPGSSPVFMGLAPSWPNDFAGWSDGTTKTISAAVHTSAGWGAPTQVSSPLGSQAWIAGVSTAPVGSGALIAWISGTTSQGTVQVSVGS